MHIEGEPISAFCYIRRSGDERNMCYLSSEKLLVRYKNRLHSFTHHEIKAIRFEHKFFLIPLVTGGIITPLSIHALLDSFMNPWMMLSLMITGMFLMYYGWEGSMSMTIKTSVKDHHFFIKEVTPNLRAFCEYAGLFISESPEKRQFYFIMNRKDWYNSQKQGVLPVRDSLPLYNMKEILVITPRHDQVLLAVDPAEDDLQISFIQNANKDKLQAVIRHNIPVEHIREVSHQN